MTPNLLSLPREQFEAACKASVRYAYLGEREGLCEVLGGALRIYIDTEDTAFAPHMILNGFWESWVTLALRRLPLGGIAYDVGANHGYFALVLAKLGYRVDAFEPQAALCSLIRRSAALNGLPDFHVVNAAVSEASGFVHVEDHADVRNSASRTCAPGGDVPLVTIDDYEGPPPTFIKVDAEGYEQQIWRGAQRTIASYRPTWLLEFMPSLYEDPRAFLEEIQRTYPLRKVSHSGTVEPISAAQALQDNFNMLWLEA